MSEVRRYRVWLEEAGGFVEVVRAADYDAAVKADDPTRCPRCQSSRIEKIAPHETWQCSNGHKFVTREIAT